MKLTQRKLKENLNYNPNTGVYTWKISPNPSIKSGDIAGYLNYDGYVILTYKHKMYKAHRLAFLYMEGYFPEYDVDHKNGIRNDNRWLNLRHAMRRCNMQNQKINSRNKSGFPGVHWHKYNKKWVAQIKINQKLIFLGYYNSSLEAALARFTAEVWDDKWTCNYRSKLVQAIKKAWPKFETV